MSNSNESQEQNDNNVKYKNLNKKIDSYKKAKKVNQQLKNLRKNPQSLDSETSREIESVEKKTKKKVEVFTKKAKEFPKNFKANSKTQLQELINTYITSNFSDSLQGKSTSTDTEKITKIKEKLTKEEGQLADAKVVDNKPEIKRLTDKVNSTKKELRRAELSLAKTNISNDALSALKNTMVQTVNRTKEELKNILLTEYTKALGCSQEQTYQAKDLYIKVRSIDIFGKTLQQDPNTVPGKYVYEFAPFSPTAPIRSFNRELWNRIQKTESYRQEYGTLYLGASGQELFDIKFVINPTPDLNGEYFKVSLKERVGGNTVTEFLSDYLNTIDILNFNELFANVLNLLLGSINMKNAVGYDDLRNQTVFEKLIQRILGMCFDNKEEVDVSGTGKLSSADQIDDSFFELSEDELIDIDNKIKNIQEKVIQYRDCGSLILPVDVDTSLSLLDEFLLEGIDPSLADKAAQNMLDSIANNPDWKINYPQFNFSNIINKQFIELLPIAVTNSVLSPKHLFPLMVMCKSLQKEYVDNLETQQDFMNEFRRMIVNISSNIQAVFIKQLFIAIKQNLRILMRDIVREQLQEILSKEQQLYLSGLNLALRTLAAIQDFRRCKNVLDELFNIVNLSFALRNALRGRPGAATSGAKGGHGGPIPAIINYISAGTKPGMTPTGILTKFIQKMEETGVPTGDMPSGKPNIGLIMTKSFNEALLSELTENGFAQVSITATEVGELSAVGFTSVKANVL